MIIGVAGYSGAGKSTFSKSLAEIIRGEVVDGDAVWMSTFYENHEVCCKIMGEGFFGKPHGTVDTEYLCRRAYKKLRRIVHPLVNARFEEKVAEITGRGSIAIIDWCFLPEIDIVNACDVKILIEAATAVRHNRLAARKNIHGAKMKIARKRDRGLRPVLQKYEPTITIQNSEDTDIGIVSRNVAKILHST